jgi:hypothetical protein
VKLGVRYSTQRPDTAPTWRFGRSALYGPGGSGVTLMATPYTLPGYPAHYRQGLSPVTATARVPDCGEVER